MLIHWIHSVNVTESMLEIKQWTEQTEMPTLMQLKLLWERKIRSVCVCVCMCSVVCMYIYIYLSVYMYIYIYVKYFYVSHDKSYGRK